MRSGGRSALPRRRLGALFCLNRRREHPFPQAFGPYGPAALGLAEALPRNFVCLRRRREHPFPQAFGPYGPAALGLAEASPRGLVLPQSPARAVARLGFRTLR